MFGPSLGMFADLSPLSQRARLELLLLEDRVVPAGDLPWPVSLQDGSKPDLFATYGQFGSGNYLRFHEGIDLVVPKDIPVTAIELGTVFNDPTTRTDPYRHLTVDTSGNEGWTYLHIVPGVNKDTGMAFAQADAVTATNKSPIGKVVDFGGGLPNHLHLGYGKGIDPYIADTFMPSADPLEFLEARPDKTTPVVEGIFFRFGTNDARGDSSGKLSAGVLRPSGNRIEQSETRSSAHQYFVYPDAADKTAIVVGARAQSKDASDGVHGGDSAIDIVAKAYDQVTSGGRKVGVKSIGFSFTGLLLGKSVRVDNTFDFSGQFAPDVNNGGKQTYESLRDAALVRTVYENDVQHPSINSTTLSQYFYTVTNTDDVNLLVEAVDRKRSWVSAVRDDRKWNEAANPDHAPNNARSLTPDDYYDVTVFARDEAGRTGEKTQRVLLDNWEQDLTLLVKQGVLNTYTLRGVNFTANALVPVWLIFRDPPMPPTDGENLETAGLFYGYAPTDADGNILPYDVTNPFPGKHFHLVADYGGGDVIYQSRLDGYEPMPQDIGSRRMSIAGGSLMMAQPTQAAPAANDTPATPTSRRPAPSGGTTADPPVTLHGTRADAPAVSKLAVTVPDTPADPFALAGDFDG